MVGWFDAVEKGNALRYGGFDQIVINKLDALTLDSSVPSELKICTAYQLADGQLTRAVPRDENLRKSLKPVYKTIAGWNENLKGMNSFEQLPAQAKEYISEMLAAIIEVAYPNGWSNIALPKIRFIGIGPDPGEIISDLPTTRQLLESVSPESLPVAS
jgi:adenylosuccinate synthase